MTTGLVKTKTPVYFGPDNTLYPSENCSAGPNDTVEILWQENNWYYIEYPAGTQRKRMYIPMAAVTDMDGTVAAYTPDLQVRFTNTIGTTYWGPGANYQAAGSVSVGEKVDYLATKRENDYVLIEYHVDGNKKKRAWIHGNGLSVAAPTRDKTMKHPLYPTQNFVNARGDGHEDYAVPKGTPVYAMCDGTFIFGYYWGKVYSNSPDSYISLGRGYKLVPDAGWKTLAGKTATAIEYGHLSELVGYDTPHYVERCNNGQGCSYNSCYEKHVVKLATKHVSCGELIGYSGNSGNSLGATGNHLHIRLV